MNADSHPPALRGVVEEIEVSATEYGGENRVTYRRAIETRVGCAVLKRWPLLRSALSQPQPQPVAAVCSACGGRLDERPLDSCSGGARYCHLVPWHPAQPFAQPGAAGGYERETTERDRQDIAVWTGDPTSGYITPDSETGKRVAAVLTDLRAAESALARVERERDAMREAVYKAHVDIGADGGVTEHDCECPVCMEYRAALSPPPQGQEADNA